MGRITARPTRKTSGPTIKDEQRRRKRLSVSIDGPLYHRFLAICARDQLLQSIAIEAALAQWVQEKEQGGIDG